MRTSTRAELQRLKSGGKSYDDVIREILEELEESDPWFREMARRIERIHRGESKLEPIETLYAERQSGRSRPPR